MNYLAAFVGHMIVSKVLVDGQQIPYEHYRKFSPHMNELESWANVFTGLELDKPATWANTGQKLISRISQTSSRNSTSRVKRKKLNPFDLAMNKIGYSTMSKNWYLADLVWEAVDKAPEEVVYFDDEYKYSRISLPNGQFMMRRQKRYKGYKGSYNVPGGAGLEDVFGGARKGGKSEDPEDDIVEDDIAIGDDDKPLYAKAGDLFIPSTDDDTEEKAAFFRAVGEILFAQRTGNLFSIDWSNDKHTFIVEPLSFPDRPYKGNALDYIDEWQMFMEQGIRRCICLQGDPGTGKSTLTRTAARKINQRTVQVTSEAFRRMHFTHWNTMLALIAPDMLILDDIDRIYGLEDYLPRFEDSYYHVPLTLFTSNDLDEIPDAFKRPGRIDQILLLADPGPDVRLEVLQEFAKMEGVGEIPQWKLPFMEKLYEDYSGAYAVEYLRRIKVHGWDYKLPEHDLTFKDLVGQEDVLDPRKNADLKNDLLEASKKLSVETVLLPEEVDPEALS